MNSIIDYYTGFGEREWTRLDREPLEYIINFHYINHYLPKIGHILDNGAGPGKYSIALAQKGYQITLTDLTPKLVSIAEEKAMEHGVIDSFEGFYVENAQNLSRFNDEIFDASLMLGPLYHLQNEDERINAVNELHRVTKKDGLVFVAFRSRSNHSMLSLIHPKHWRPNDNMDSINDFYCTGRFTHSDEGRFTGAYFFNIDEINPFMESKGFETLDLIGSTNIGTLLNQEQLDYWKEKGEEEYSKLIDFLIQRARDPYLLGVSSHLLYIGRKK
ncbi:class I SAM-dependent methyltransferase [Bacillus sp. NEB1478]|uniref:class I SAM-dependent methyltransferase n=1 Tax=Bacillus sp. NEB1478 TaxID=3073816 RepID=UPI00287396AB|nr:class I SAM-dependent methyltransferase [Bacillus sp. NEB1478]WNB91492.1 class I SAM-dependent methyltransferase [Bacillus sp. NEB1478]